MCCIYSVFAGSELLPLKCLGYTNSIVMKQSLIKLFIFLFSITAFFANTGVVFSHGREDAMMVYDTLDVTSTPKYRLWGGSNWSAQGDATNVTGEIRQMVVRYAPTRDEAIMVVQTSDGDIQAQVWDGTGWGTVTILGTHASSLASTDTQSLYRGFDLAYEQSSGDAVVVYGDGTADPDYSVWDGSNWSSGVDINVPNTGSTKLD